MAKSMTIGHFRNTIIGQIIYNILLQTGCFHMSRNYIGDR
ncbi:arginine--tRNA ligase [Patescibacteria group bacterium]|nr:arginine--tRNA ligase [Patescibacteria group bacterium]